MAATCRSLAKNPRMGVAYDCGSGRLAGMRRLPVREFGSYQIFYRADERAIEVIRVLHGARDIEGLFDAEEN